MLIYLMEKKMKYEYIILCYQETIRKKKSQKWFIPLSSSYLVYEQHLTR